MDAKTHALNIRTLRESRHWSQEELAICSGVDVRTIQRAEGGRRTSVDTLRAIAAAFDTTIEVLSLSQEHLAAEAEAFFKTHKIIELVAVESGPDLSRYLGGVEAFQFETMGKFTDEQLDLVAEFESELRDWMDVGSDASPLMRREAERVLDASVARLRDLKVRVSAGEEELNLKSGDHAPFKMQVLHVAVTPGDVHLRGVVRERNQRITFG